MPLKKIKEKSSIKEQEAKNREAQEIEKLMQEAANFRNSIKKPENWIKSFPQLKQFQEKFKYTDWDQLWKFDKTHLKDLDIPPDAAMPILRAIEMHPDNPKHNQYKHNRNTRKNAHRNNHKYNTLIQIDGEPKNWIKSLQNFKNFNSAFKHTNWGQMQRFTTNDLKNLGIPENKINLLLEEIKKYIKESRNRNIDQQELKEIKNLEAEMEEIKNLEKELKDVNKK